MKSLSEKFAQEARHLMLVKLAEQEGKEWTVQSIRVFRAQVKYECQKMGIPYNIPAECSAYAADALLECLRIELVDGFFSLDELEERLSR